MTSARTSTFDGTRNLVLPKPTLRGWSHQVGFAASLVLGTVLVAAAPTAQRLAVVIYAITLSGMLGASALYHRGTWTPRARALLQRVDHAMIFLLIAGTATPVVARSFSAAAPGLLAGLWILTAVAVVAHVVRMNAPECLVGGVYVLFGLLGVVALPAVWMRSGPTAFALLLGGGLFYIAGAVGYHLRRPDPWPQVFGYHEVFHLFVCAAAALHYVAIALYLR